MRSILAPTILLLAVAALGCEKFPGFKKASDPSSGSAVGSSGGTHEERTSGSTASGESTPAPGPTEKGPPPAAPANAAATPNPERVILRAGYGDEPISSMVEVERSGTFRLEKRAEVDAGRELVSCTGALTTDVAAALWKAVDAAAFIPPEQGFTKPIHAPRGVAPPKADAGASAPVVQARWSVMRVVADLTLVPQNEAAARTLVGATRTAIASAEQQSTAGATCKRGR